MSYISESTFYEAIGAMKAAPQDAVKNGHWSTFVETIKHLVDIVKKNLDEKDSDDLYYYEYPREFIRDVNEVISEDKNEVDKKFKEDSKYFNDEIETYYEFLINDILDVFDEQDAFGSEGWRHLMNWN